MNYVLLYPDELRAESIACYGHPLVITPNMDALAAEGTLFEQNYSAHPVCVASRCSLMTGWFPHVRGYRCQQNLLSDKEKNFITYLNDAGWTTAITGKDDCFDDDSTDRVFSEHFKQLPPNRPKNPNQKKNYTMIMPPTPDEKEAEGNDAYSAANAVKFINEHAKDDNPFFLWVNFLLPHPPYVCPESYYEMYKDEDIPALRSDDWVNEKKPSAYHLCRDLRDYKDEPEGEFTKVNRIYLGSISYVDTLIGRVVQALKDNGIYDDTTIILCSDHGDFAGDASLVEKCPNGMDDMLLRVPLIIRRPGENQGQRISTLTQSIDIMPTIFDFAGLEIGHDQFGISLRKEIETGVGDEERVVYSEGGYDTREPQCFESLGPEDSPKRKFMGEGTVYYPKMYHQDNYPDSVCRSVMRRDKQYKIVIRTNGEHELYDMIADPLEYNNLYGEKKYESVFYERVLKAMMWMTHTSDAVILPELNIVPWFLMAEKKENKED